MTARIHHIGYVVSNISNYSSAFPEIVLENSVFDPLQEANLSLYKVGDGSLLEFIQPVGERSFTWGFLQSRGDGLHHVCYEGMSLDVIEQFIRLHKMFKLRGPMPAILFNRDVVFAITRQKAILEFML